MTSRNDQLPGLEDLATAGQVNDLLALGYPLDRVRDWPRWKAAARIEAERRRRAIDARKGAARAGLSAPEPVTGAKVPDPLRVDCARDLEESAGKGSDAAAEALQWAVLLMHAGEISGLCRGVARKFRADAAARWAAGSDDDRHSEG